MEELIKNSIPLSITLHGYKGCKLIPFPLRTKEIRVYPDGIEFPVHKGGRICLYCNERHMSFDYFIDI